MVSPSTFIREVQHTCHREAMPICWCLSSGWLDVGRAMGAHEQRVHFIKWFIQDMIINGGTLLSRQESIDARSRHSRSLGLADRERDADRKLTRNRAGTRVRMGICMFVPVRERRRERVRWMTKRETGDRHAFSPISSTHVRVLSPFLPLRTLSAYATLRPTPRSQLH